MRILLVISGLGYGGAESQLIAISREMAKRGHVVAIYTLNHENPRAWELAGSGVQLVADQKQIKIDPMVLFRLRRFINTFHADIVHGYLYDGDFYSRLAAFGTGISVLNSERSDNYRLNLNQRIGQWLTRRLVSGVVANSFAGGRFAQRLYHLPPEEVHVVWNGIALDKIDARIRGSKSEYKQEFFGIKNIKVACLVGSIIPQKDYFLALEVANLLTRENEEWRTLFVGDLASNSLKYKGSVMQRFQELEMEGRAAFAGLRKDAIEIMSQCEVVFSTSTREGFPNVVLEAMSVGTPVVSTVYSDISQILPFPWQVVDSRDPVAIVGTILRVFSDRQKVAEAQRRWVADNATIEKAGEKLEEIYKARVAASIK